MSWRDTAASLMKRFGPESHPGLKTAIEALLPGRAGLADLVLTAMRKAVARRRGAALPLTENDLRRLGELIGLLDGDLAPLLERLPHYADNRGRKQGLARALKRPALQEAWQRAT